MVWGRKQGEEEIYKRTESQREKEGERWEGGGGGGRARQNEEQHTEGKSRKDGEAREAVTQTETNRWRKGGREPVKLVWSPLAPKSVPTPLLSYFHPAVRETEGKRKKTNSPATSDSIRIKRRTKWEVPDR